MKPLVSAGEPEESTTEPQDSKELMLVLTDNSPPQGYRNRYNIIDHGHEKKLLCIFFVDLY